MNKILLIMCIMYALTYPHNIFSLASLEGGPKNIYLSNFNLMAFSFTTLVRIYVSISTNIDPHFLLIPR